MPAVKSHACGLILCVFLIAGCSGLRTGDVTLGAAHRGVAATVPFGTEGDGTTPAVSPPAPPNPRAEPDHALEGYRP